MSKDEAYRLLLSEFLKEKVGLFGDVAVRKARSISGLDVAPDGKVVAVVGDPLETLRELLAVFERLSGLASTVSARRLVQTLGLREKIPGIELPDGLT